MAPPAHSARPVRKLNSRVHFTESKWDAAEKQRAGKLSLQLTDTFTRFGDTTVVDLGSPTRPKARATFAKIRYTIRRGKVIYSSEEK